MNELKVSDYLQDFNKYINRGKCKSCSTLVSWTRERVASHKRSNCTNVSAEERNFFAKRKTVEVSVNGKINELTNPAEKKFQPSKEVVDAAVGKFFYRSGISLDIADSTAWKSLITCLNPSYAQQVPSESSLSNRLLDKQYDEARADLDEILSESKNLTITSDGWTNSKGDGIVNFMIKVPGRPSLFYKSVDTSGTNQTSETIANEICDVIQNIGEEKIDAVITENVPMLQEAWKIIEEQFPCIMVYGCAAHALNLLIKDIVKIPENSKTISDASKIIQFVTNHDSVNEMFEESRSVAGVTTKLSSPGSTRWYSDYTSGKSLLDSKVAVKCLANENSEKLENILPKTESAEVTNLMKSDEFWCRLESLVEDLKFPSEVIGEFLK